MSIGEDGRAGEALELAILSLSSTSSSLIPKKNALFVSQTQKSTEAIASVGPQFIIKESAVAFLRKIIFLQIIFTRRQTSHLGLGSQLTFLADGRFLQ